MDTENSKSERLLKIMSKNPSWLLKWGVTVFFFFVVSLVSISFIIEYPDKILASIEVTTSIPPVTVHALANGRITKLFVKDNDFVNAGAILAIIENTTNFDDVEAVKKKLISNDLIQIDKEFELGELQPDFNSYISEVKESLFFHNIQYHNKKVKEYQNQLGVLQVLLSQKNRQLSVFKQELLIIEKQYKRDSILFFEKNAISADELNSAKLNYLSKVNELISINQSITNTRMQINQLLDEISELNFDYEKQHHAINKATVNTRNKLISSISKWEQNYIIKAPINGYVSFYKLWAENQFVNAGEGAFSIVPKQESTIVGKIIMPIAKSGEVEIGQHVNVKLHSYPYQEHGFLKGEIITISSVPINNTYAVEVIFPKGLNTTYNEDIKFMQNMTGDAEIITKDTKLIERIFYKFKDLIKNN